MNWHNNPFAQLAVRVRRGEESAAEQFRQHMTPQLERMVRRVLNYGACPSAFEQRIQAETERVLTCSRGRLDGDSDQVIGQVAHRLCQDMVDSLCEQWKPEDTWSAAAEPSRRACVLA